MASSNIAVVGDRDSVLCLRALGISVFPVANSEKARPILRRLCAEDYQVIFVTEPIAAEMLELIDELARKPLPSIVLIPSSQGSLGLGTGRIKRTVIKALGTDILGEDEER